MTVMPPHLANGGQQMSCRQVLLRLDDGSLIGDSKWLQDSKSSGAVLLTPDQAFLAGRVREADVHRLRNILQKLEAYLPQMLFRSENPTRQWRYRPKFCSVARHVCSMDGSCVEAISFS